MARNRDPVKPVESQTESGEEDEEGSSEEVDSQESDSEPEPEQTQTQTAMQKKFLQAPPPPPPPQQQAPSSSEEEESGSETESESDGPDTSVRPLASKSMEEGQKASKSMEEGQKSSNGARKARSKPNAPEPVTPTKAVSAKRPAEDTAANKDAKKKKTSEAETSEKKSNIFQRLWSEEDEIAILEGMIDYTAKKKMDPTADFNVFHDFIKKNLRIDFTRTQLQDKIRRLKKKFENNKSKEKEGKDRTFSKIHEQNAYDLSKIIWGNGTGKESGGEKVVGSTKSNGIVVRKTPFKKLNVAEIEEVKDVKNAAAVSSQGGKSLPKKLNFSSGSASMEESMLITGRELYETGKGQEGENEWHKLRVDELELYLKQLEMRVAQTKLVLGVMKRGDH